MPTIGKFWLRFGWERATRLKIPWQWQERHILIIAGWGVGGGQSLSLEFDPRYLGIGPLWQQFRGGSEYTLVTSFDFWVYFFPTLSLHFEITKRVPRPSLKAVAS